MKHIVLGYFFCILSCSAYGMKRSAQNNALHLAASTHQTMEPAAKKAKLIHPKKFTPAVIFTSTEHQNRIIIQHLNNALMYLGNAQEAVKHSNNKMELRISQMHKEVSHAQHFVSLLEKYQLHIDTLFIQMQRLRNHLAHYLEITKEHVVDTTFDIAFNNQTLNRTAPLLPNSIPTFIDVETPDDPAIENLQIPVEAEAVYTAVVAPQKRSRFKNNNLPLQMHIDVER